MKKVGFFLFFTFLSITLSIQTFSAEKNKPEKIHITGKTIIDGKPFPGVELYLQITDWIENYQKKSIKKIGSSGKDGSFSTDLKKKQHQSFSILALKPGEVIGSVIIIDKTINESAVIPMSQLNSSFSGIVKDGEGKPLPGVDVKIKGMSIESLPFENQSFSFFSPLPGTFTKTDKNGQFAFDRLPQNANLNLEFEADGYCESETGNVEYKSGDDNTEIILYPEGCVEGRITYSDTGKPVAGVTVSCSGQRSKTDKNGFYKIPKLSEGNYTVSLSLNKPEYDGRASEPKENIGVEYGKTVKVDMELKKGILITGKVTDKLLNKPAEGVNVRIKSRQTVTDKNGIYKLWGHPGEIEITATGDENSNYSNNLNIGVNVKSITIFQTDTIKTVDLIVGSKVKITGIVRYPDGRPAIKVKVYYFGTRPIYTDNEGKFTDKLQGQAIGKKIPYIADIPSEELEGSTEIEAVEGGYGEIFLHPYEYLSVKGKTVDKNNNSVPGVKISLIRTTGMSSIERDSTAVSDQNGDFIVEKLRKKRHYLISAYDTQICSPVIDTGKAIQSEPYILVIPDSTHSIWGKITDENGTSVSGAELNMWFSNGHKQTLSDSLGYYRFDGIINGFHEIGIISQKYGRESFRNLVINSENNLVMRDKNRWLNGYVYDKNGKPIPGIYVSTNLTPYYQWGNRAKTDTNGKFRLKGIDRDIVDLQVFEERPFQLMPPSKTAGVRQPGNPDSEKAPELFRQEFKGIKTNQEIILKTDK